MNEQNQETSSVMSDISSSDDVAEFSPLAQEDDNESSKSAFAKESALEKDPHFSHLPSLSRDVISSYINAETPLATLLQKIQNFQFFSLPQERFNEIAKEANIASSEQDPGLVAKDLISQLLSVSVGICGATWSPGEIAFKCKTCEKDPTCAICKDCFVNGNHEGHDYALITTSSGMCDCGDADSWDERGFCSHHKGSEQDTTQHLPWDLRKITKDVCFAYMHLFFVHVMQIYNLVHERELLDELDAKLHGCKTDFDFLCRMLIDTTQGYPCYKRFFAEALSSCFDEEKYDRTGMLDMILQRYSELPADAASSCHQFISVLISDAECKKLVAKLFCKHYRSIMSSYCEQSSMDGEHHLSSISVQIFTVPPLAEELTFKHNLLENMIATLTEVAIKGLSNEETPLSRLSATASILQGSGFFHLMLDFSYILMHSSICEYFLTNENISPYFIGFLSFVHSWTEVKRIDSDSDIWHAPFTIEMRLIRRIIDHFDGCIEHMFKSRPDQESQLTDSIFKDIIQPMCVYLKEYFDHDDTMKHTATNMFGQEHISFNLVQGPVTFHFPLHKVMAQLIYSTMRNNPQLPLQSIFRGEYNHQDFLLKLVENPLRVFVAGSHIRRRLWPRDNMQIIEQTINYEQYKPDYTVCNDLFLLQTLAAMLPSDSFLASVLSRYQNSTALFSLDIPDDPIDLGLEEDVLRFLLSIFTNRICSGVHSDKEIARLFLLHDMFSGPKPFSELSKAIPKRFENVPIEEILQEVSTQNAESNFVVKKEMWKFFNPYFVSMSPREMEMALTNHASVFKDECLALKQPENLMTPLEPLTALLHNQNVHYLLFVILYRTVKNLLISKPAPSDRSLMMVLHSIVYIIESMQTPHVKSLLADEVSIPGSSSSAVNLLKNLHFPFLKDRQDGTQSDATIINCLIEIFNSAECKDHHSFLQKRLFPLLMEHDDESRDILEPHMAKKEQKSLTAKKKKRSSKAKRRNQRILEQFKKQQQKFDERAFLGDAMEDEPEEDELCCFCHAPANDVKKLSALAYVTQSSTLKLVHNQNVQDFYRGGFDEKADVDFADDKPYPPHDVEDEQSNVTDSSTHSYDLSSHSNINLSEGAQVNTCGHRCHPECLQSYYFSLLNTRRRFRGARLLDLDKMEILCPICSSIMNVMLPTLEHNTCVHSHSHEECPKNTPFSHQRSDDYADLMKVLISRPSHFDLGLTANDQSDITSFRDSVGGAELTLNAVAYNIATREVAQRREYDTLKEFSDKDRELIRLLIKCVSAVKLREENSGAIVDLIVQSMRGKTSCFSSETESENTFLPLLSSDLFSIFMRLVVLQPRVHKWSHLSLLIELLYCANILQCLIMLVSRVHISTEGASSEVQAICQKLGIDADSLSNDTSPSLTVPNLQTIDKELESLTLVFLRRVSLFVSVYFDQKKEIPLPVDSEHKALREYLNLPCISEVLKGMLRYNSPVQRMAVTWMQQLKSAVKMSPSHANNLVPRFVKPLPFHFIALPKLYQNLFLHYAGASCKTCGKAYTIPILSLTDGRLTALKKPCSCYSLSSAGGVTTHAQTYQSGQGVYLAIKECLLLVVSSGRYSFLKPMYKDKFGEVDENLRRGKPLFLDRKVLHGLESKFLLRQFEQDTVSMVNPDARSGRSTDI